MRAAKNNYSMQVFTHCCNIYQWVRVEKFNKYIFFCNYRCGRKFYKKNNKWHEVLCLGCLAAGQQPVDRCFLFMHCNIYNWLFNACMLNACELIALVYALLWQQCHFLRVFSYLAVFFYLHVSQLIVQPSPSNDRHRRHIRTTNKYSIFN